MKKILTLIIFQYLILACNSEKKIIVQPVIGPSLAVKVYLLDMIEIIKQNSINRLNIEWPVFSAEVLKEAGNAQTIEGATSALKLALTLLNDNHSFIQTKNASYLFNNNPSIFTANTDLIGSLPEDIGYIKVGGNFSSSTDVITLANSIQNDIKNADKENLKGWIVDLRGNGGGNMWPMLAGLGPILGSGILGYFIDVNGSTSSWSYNEGKSMYNGQAIGSVTNTYVLKMKNPKVAVLINQSIASSGEATAIAFTGRPNTKFFGTPTFGLSTANQSFDLNDGAKLFLTVSTMADRNRKLYGKKVEPDVLTSTAESTNNEAIKWLLEKGS